MPTHYKGKEKEKRALNALIPLFRAVDTLAGLAAARIERHGLTAGQFGVLETLLHLGPMCQREIAAKLLRSGGNTTLVVDNLEKLGLVRRERRRDDRRMITVRLTPHGRKAITKIFREHAAATAREMSALTVAEQEELRRLCRKLGRSQKEERHDSNSKV
ncbi:MAG: MarR family winged helix-turn-helix transcriptional regulator [Candidatus Acidiferrales bacterium]